MKTLYKIIAIFTLFLFSNNLLAQLGPKVIKQPPRVNGILKASNNATTKVKIHANSNTVIGTSKTHPNYSKRQTKKGELKEEKEVAQKSKKQK